MKPYMVICIQERLQDLMPGRGDLGFITWAGHLEESDPGNMDGRHPIYYVDNEVHGNALATFLASKRPGTTWVVAKSTSSFRCTPGPVKRAVFSDAGLLPTN